MDYEITLMRLEDWTAVREMLKPLGIKVDVQRIPWDKFINDIEGKAAFSVDGFYSRPTIDSSMPTAAFFSIIPSTSRMSGGIILFSAFFRDEMWQ